MKKRKKWLWGGNEQLWLWLLSKSQDKFWLWNGGGHSRSQLSPAAEAHLPGALRKSGKTHPPPITMERWCFHTGNIQPQTEAVLPHAAGSLEGTGLVDVTQGRIPKDSSDGRHLEQANSPRGKAEERQQRHREGRRSYCRVAVWDNTNIL